MGLKQGVQGGKPATDARGCPEGNFTGTRTDGDIMVSMDFANGGVLGTPEVYSWDDTIKKYVLSTDLDSSEVAFFKANTTTPCGDWGCRNDLGENIAPAPLPAGAFVEGFLNVSQAFPTGGNCFSTFLSKTRTSGSETSQLKDFALGSFNTCDATISITPDGVNEVGDDHEFTVHVESNENGELAPVEGVEVTGDLGGVGSWAAGTDGTCTTDVDGDCTLTISSSVHGTTTVDASATIEFTNGLALFRSTAVDADPAGTGAATKNWVDAYVRVDADDVNEVNDDHEFTVEYGVLGGTPDELTIDDVAITPEVVDADGDPYDFDTDCDDADGPDRVGTTDVWQCSVTINSTEAGVYTVTAEGTSTVTMDGVTDEVALDRETVVDEHGPGGNEGAVKTYVDARILLTEDGLNQVDNPNTDDIEEAHTVTAQVQTKDGSGEWTNAPNAAVTFFGFGDGGVGEFVDGDDTCTTAGPNGTCSVQINSFTTGTSTVNATAVVTVHGLALTRSTNTEVNTAAGGSNHITKKWVDASITIEEDAVNVVNDPHTFTVTVTPDRAGSTVTNVAVSASFSGPVGAIPTIVTNCDANIALDPDAPAGAPYYTCTYEITSSVAGLFDVDATTTVDYAWGTSYDATVVRSTGGDDGDYSGPNGNDGSTKKFVDARISISKDGINRVGEAHDATAFVEVNEGSGWVPAPQGTDVTFDIASDTAASTFVDDDFTCDTVLATGKCTVKFVSDEAGITWVSASTTLTVDTVQLTRATATAADDPKNLRKEWVGAVISITPTAVNEVGVAHEFDILVTAFAEEGDITIGTPTFTLTPDTSTNPLKPDRTLSCKATAATADGAERECTLTINSAVPGVFTATAFADVDIYDPVSKLTESFDLVTDGADGSSLPAVKTYVDARISLEKDGVNEVGDPHPVKATVAINPGTGWIAAPDGTVVKLTTDFGALSAATCTVAGGICSVTLTSADSGVSTVSARVDLEVLDEPITRITGTALNTTAGGSGNLTKRWVDGAISVSPSAVNPVGAEHVFEIKAVASPAGAGTPSFVITPTLTKGAGTADPSEYESTCGPVTPVGNTATCTVTINSDTPGLYTMNTSVSITIADVTLVRNTDPTDLIPSGLAVSPPATKRYVDADIQVFSDGINQTGQDHTVTGHVNVNDGSGQPKANAPEGTRINFTTTGPGTLTATFCLTVDDTGSCSVTLNSTETGTTLVHATSSISVQGVPFLLSTNGAAPNSGDLKKHWVDGSITVTPDGINPVNQKHDFVVTYTVVAPAATQVTLNSLTATTTGTPSTPLSACVPVQVVNATTWSCTVSLNSSEAAVFEVDAVGSATVKDSTMASTISQTVIRSTTGNAGKDGNDGATKRYVDARIRVTPGGLNPVDDAHTVTATVETNSGTGGWVKAPEGTDVEFTRTGAGTFKGAETCKTVDQTGACSIQITSPDAGTTIVGATVTLSVEGVSLTRTTGMTPTDDGTGPITKEWVDGSITVEADATNAIRDDHPFTITAYAHLPAGSADETVKFNSITPSVSPIPDLGVTSDCDAPTVAANGLSATCTYTINSSVPGVFRVDATTSITIDNVTYPEVTLSRSTTGDFGPNGTDGADKTYVDAAVTIGLDGVNAVGDDHTVTGTATKNAGTGGWVPAEGETINFAITSGPGTLDETSCVANDKGTCFVILDSDTAGVTWVSASTLYEVGGVTLSRTTAVDGADDPDNLRKEWVRANITINPTAVNTVGEPHTFDIIVSAESSGAAIDIGTVSATVDPTPDTSNLNCANPSGSTGVVTQACTFTINDGTAGIHTANASVKVTIGGVVFDLATNGQGANSGSAKKTYVDARIKLANDGVNEVGDPHPVTATVEVNDGEGWDPAPAGVTVALTETGPGEIPATCTTGDAGTCTVDLTSATAGVSTVHAAVTTTVLGEVITRETSTAVNTDAGGSADLTKRWVDALVTITPDGVNEVGDAHTFTVAATAIPSGAGTPTFTITPSVTPAPSSLTTTCGSPTIAGDTATCTVTINSSATGNFAANVTATVTVGDVAMTRSTDASVAPAGPGGSGPARKTYVDAFITIVESAVNQLNDPHTFTVTATAIPSGAAPVVFGSITTTLAPVPGTVSSTCDKPTVDGNKATCTLTINSSVVGTFVANATANLTIGGTALVRSTDSTVATAGPGGSGPATKQYVERPLQVLGEVVVKPAPPATLPRTGVEVLQLISVAVLLLVGGAFLTATVRRRRGEAA